MNSCTDTESAIHRYMFLCAISGQDSLLVLIFLWLAYLSNLSLYSKLVGGKVDKHLYSFLIWLNYLVSTVGDGDTVKTQEKYSKR